ncbi:glycosyltransferase family 2 protein [Flavobacterium hercynium]|uniref:Glycosyltransferase 2-like domain-containing protein n=1 Tax=Flavobacterium hercynium TaxID=387094 RepID=A0A226HD13_9FLAO|nr:glycosyltransferase family 2 protein [Flavobacterium hercynium]OXA92187.1 hypothetical protein B0A66_10500 [Flavobacterium hercynium]SMP24538.1 Glycosyl transferase family 2 [Flavobacterium hercynium]
MLKKPIISICIPTYNRDDKVIELVNSILQYKGDEIEVLVLDNSSTDETNSLFNKIVDNRLSYVRNNENIGGIKNVFKALVIANGEYCFLCLDKDRIKFERIGDLLDNIKSSDVLFGHCVLNAAEKKTDIFFEKGFPSVYNMSYLAAHPSGMFYKTEALKNLPVLNQIFNENKKFGFYAELINAEMSVLGKSKIINIPAFFTETKEDCGKIRSFTYTNENEIFFFPSKRSEEFLIYSENLYSLNLTLKEKNRVLKKIFLKGLLATTVDFKSILNDISICDHYFIATRKVSLLELIKNDILFCKNFIKSDLPLSVFFKFYICVISNMKIICAMIYNKLKK